MNDDDTRTPRHQQAAASGGSGPLASRVAIGRCAIALAAIVAAACGQSATPTPSAPVVGRNTPITPVNPPSSAFQQPSLAMDPAHPGHLAVAYQEGTHFNTCYLALSSNGGSSWNSTALVGAGGSYSLPAGTTHCQQPKVAYGSGGTLYYVFQNSGFRMAEPQSIHVLSMTSTDGGSTFTTPQIMDPQMATPNDWYPVAAYDSKTHRLYMAWSRYAQNFTVFPGYVVATSSNDQGNTYATPTRVEPQSESTNYVGGPVMAVAPNGTVYVSYLPSDPKQRFSTSLVDDLQVADSTDGGQTYTTTAVNKIVTACTPGDTSCTLLRPGGELMSIAAGRTAGRVYLTWWDDRGPGGLGRISFASSADSGHTWSAPRIVGVPRTADHQQWHPAISVAPNGTIDIVYNDIDTANTQSVYWISSSNGGSTFSSPLKVNSQASNLAVGPAAGATQRASFGAFLGLVSTDQTAYVSWTDSRRGDVNTGHQDVYFATIQR